MGDTIKYLVKMVEIQDRLIKCLDSLTNQTVKLAEDIKELKATVSDLKLNYIPRRF